MIPLFFKLTELVGSFNRRGSDRLIQVRGDFRNYFRNLSKFLRQGKNTNTKYKGQARQKPASYPVVTWPPYQHTWSATETINRALRKSAPLEHRSG